MLSASSTLVEPSPCLPPIPTFPRGGRLGVDLGLAVSSRLSCEQFYSLPAIGLFHWLLLLSVARLLSSKCPVPGAALRGAPGDPAQPSGRSAEPRAAQCPRGERSAGGARPPAPRCNRGRGCGRCGGCGRSGAGPGGGAGAGGGVGRAGQGSPSPPLPITAVPFSPAGSRRPAAAAAGTAAGAARAGSFWTSPP